VSGLCTRADVASIGAKKFSVHRSGKCGNFFEERAIFLLTGELQERCTVQLRDPSGNLFQFLFLFELLDEAGVVGAGAVD
jgi:hypothetical protein